MKLLWFSHFVPFPPRGGAPQRCYNLIRQVSKSHELFLVALNLRGEPSSQLAAYAKELRNYCADVEIWELPYQWRGRRWWAELVLSPFYHVHYGGQALWSPELATRWEQTLRRHPWELVHFDSLDLALYLRPAARFRKVLDHQNCESAMAYRRAQNERNPLKKAYLWHQARKLERLEREICRQFDVNLTVSEPDADLLCARSPQAHFHVVENGTDTSYYVPAAGPEEPKRLIFAASLGWYPNISAVQFFVREVWPLIKRGCAGVRFSVAGQRPPEPLVRWLKQDPNIVVVPSPEDIRPWIARAAVFVCPMRDGGGTKLKILDAMAMGKTVVSTAVGAEGLHVKHGENILLADAPQDFAREVLRALEDAALRRRIAAAGRILVEKEYSWEVIGGHLEQAYRCVQNRNACERRAELS